MTQTAHIGYTNAAEYNSLFKGDFIIRMDEALSSLISLDAYQKIINGYIELK